MTEDKLAAVANRYAELTDMQTRPDFYENPQRAAELLREARELQPVAEAYDSLCRERDNLSEIVEMQKDPEDAEMKELLEEEYLASKARISSLQEQLKILLLPKDPDDGKNIMLEIRAGVGGEESALFAHSLYRMYQMYAEKRGWAMEVMSMNATDLGGLKEIICLVSGKDVYARLKYESGVHRVQRVPETESGGRIHTSTATVAVMPEASAVEVDLNPADIKMEVFRSSGAGGQHINKTSSAVRLIHIPTGTVVECQEERSQFQNREKAMRMLYTRLYNEKKEAQEAKLSAEKRSQVGSGMRNEKIRTYNYPQSRVTDHRIGLTLYRLNDILDGDLDEIIDALTAADQAEKLRQSAEEEA